MSVHFASTLTSPLIQKRVKVDPSPNEASLVSGKANFSRVRKPTGSRETKASDCRETERMARTWVWTYWLGIPENSLARSDMVIVWHS